MAGEKSLIREVITLIFGEFGGKMLRDLIRGELKEGAGVLAERVRQVIKENPRSDLLFTLLSLEPEDFNKFRVHHREAMEGRLEGWSENSFVVAFGYALPRNKDGTLDTERAKKVLKQLVNMDEQKLHQALEILRHDPIAQPVRTYMRKGRDLAETITNFLGNSWGKIDERATQAAPGLHALADKIRARYERR